MASVEDQEAAAAMELRSIHPSIRSEVTKNINPDAWQAMSIVEKLKTIKDHMSEVDKQIVSPWQAEVAAQIAAEPPLPPIEAPDEKDEREAEEDAPEEEQPQYWRPEGRCPYGMDTGHWVVTEDELKQHNSKHSCWISVDGQVYDVTDWLAEHPGGAAAILKYGGEDASEGFHRVQHTFVAKSRMKSFRVGHMDGAAPVVDDSPEESTYDAELVSAVLRGMTKKQGPPPTDPEEIADLELRAVHPNIRLEIVEGLGKENWIALSSIQKMALIKEKVPDVEQRSAEEMGRMILAEVSKQRSEEAAADKKPAAADAESETCPISGKIGKCPMQEMIKNGTLPMPKGKAAPVKRGKKATPAAQVQVRKPDGVHEPNDCTIS